MFCQLFAKGLARLRKVLGRQDEMLLYARTVFRDDSFVSGPPAWQRIMIKIANLPPGDEALEGLQRLLRLIRAVNDRNLGKNFISIFEVIPDPNDLDTFLKLFKEAYDAIGVNPQDLTSAKGLDVLTNALSGLNNVQGTWYQLQFVKRRGWAKLNRFEEIAGGPRGLDVILDVAPPEPKYFELKSGTTGISAEQGIAHLTRPPVQNGNEWTRFRFVVNKGGDDKTDDARRFLREMLSEANRNQPPINAILAEIQARTGNPPNFFQWEADLGQSLDQLSPLQRRSVEETEALLFEAFQFTPPVRPVGG